MEKHLLLIIVSCLTISCAHKVPEGPEGEVKRLIKEYSAPAIKYDIEELNRMISGAKNKSLTVDQRQRFIDTIRRDYHEFLNNVTLENIGSPEFEKAMSGQQQFIAKKWTDEYARQVANEMLENEKARVNQ